MLRADGFLVFGAEPVVDPDGLWGRAVPYPWGPRLDGLSLRAMQTHGWMELGFQKSYFEKLLARHGLVCDYASSSTNSLASSIVARRKPVVTAASPQLLTGAFQTPTTDIARDFREAMLTIVGIRNGDWFVSEGREGVVLYGPYMQLAAGNYKATFEIACTVPLSSSRQIATCDVACGNEGRRLTSVDVTGSSGGGPFEVVVPFTLAEVTEGMQFRVIAADGVPISVRGFAVVELNLAANPQ